MSYKERVIEGAGFSFGGAQALDGASMIRDLEEKKTISGEGEGNKVLIPFHSLEAAVIAATMVDREDKNPYYCDANGGGDGKRGSKVGEAEVCLGCVGE